MIRFALSCGDEHSFEGWFRSNDDFDSQLGRKLIGCPVCGSNLVHKALMAPNVSTSKIKDKITLAQGEVQRQAMAALRALTKKMKDGAENVGDNFAVEARKIHEGESEARGIYGEATPQEAQALIEDGIEFHAIPTLPDDLN